MTVDVRQSVHRGARRGSAGLHIYNPQGKQLAYISTGRELPNVAFGYGENANLVYLSSGKSPYTIRLA